MAEFEKYIPRRINKDFSPESLISGDRGFLPGDMIDALNVRFSGHGANQISKNIKGTVLRSYPEMPSGDKKVIGVLPNKRDNSIIFFLWSQIGEHRVVEYNLATELFTTLLTGASLNFLPNKYITQGGVLDNLLIWNDATNPPAKINIQRAKDGFYVAPYAAEAISLGAFPPGNSPTAVKLTTAGIINTIAKSSWQFSYQYVYQDNETSVWSPLSKLIAANFKADYLYDFDNAVDVTITIEPQLIGIIKSVNIAYREGNKGDYTIWDIIDNPLLTTYTKRFMNNGRAQVVAKSEEIRIQDAIPPVTNALEIIDSRIFVPLNNVGFDVETNFVLTTAVGTEAQVSIGGTPSYPRRYNPSQRYFKDGSIHGVGIIFYDGFNRPSFVRADRFLQFQREDLIKETLSVTPPAAFPFDYLNLGSQINNKKFINWSLSGTPPAGMKKYQLVVTKDQFYSVYGQSIVSVFRYVGEMEEGMDDKSIFAPEVDLGGGTTATMKPVFTFQGKQFVWQQDGEVFSDFREYKSLYLQIPNNFPFQVEKGDLVRITGSTKEFVVRNVIGNFLDIGKNEDEMNLYAEAIQFAEIYRPALTRDEKFYEVGEVFDIVAGAFNTLSGRINGDTYTMSFRTSMGSVYAEVSEIIWEEIVINNNQVSHTQDGPIPQRGVSATTQVVESPTPSFEPASIGYNVLNYAKDDADYGRVHTTNRNEKKQNYYSTYGFSDPYVQGTDINGLSTFNAANQYPMAVERGVITTSKKAGSVLLAIHERETSTLYIGEGFIRQGRDFILAKTESVVGDDRKLMGGFGTINPESVTEAYDTVFFWDAFKGAVVRYTNAGLFPISNNLMENYFYEKGRQLFPYRNIVKVTTAFDYRFKQLIVAFGEVRDESGALLVPGETWAFDVKKEEWHNRVSYIPEMIIGLNLSLISFSQGNLWLHNLNETCNNFYGVQYNRVMRFACNPQLGKNKRFLNLHHKGLIAQDPNSEAVVVRCYTPEGQESYIPAYEFELDEGKMVAPILKNIKSPVEEGQLALRSGDDMMSNYMEFEVINDRMDEAPCSQINVVYKTEEFSI